MCYFTPGSKRTGLCPTSCRHERDLATSPSDRGLVWPSPWQYRDCKEMASGCTREAKIGYQEEFCHGEGGRALEGAAQGVRPVCHQRENEKA